MELQLVYEDQDMLVCRKPAGLAVQSASFGKKDLESLVRNYLFEKSGQTNPYLGIVHRLDQPVQGLVVFAKHAGSAAKLSAQVQDGTMKKQYLAVVTGEPDPREGTLVNYLKKETRGNLSKAVAKDVPGAKRASLSYRTVRRTNHGTLLEIDLHTGRHHQIRVQMAAAGMPIYGDAKYGSGQAQCDAGQGQIALCAHRLQLLHPKTKREMTFTCVCEGEQWT